MTKQRVRVLIVNHSRREQCGGQCGLDWSQAEVCSQARSQLRLKYGDKVSLEYVDLDRQPPGTRLPPVARSLALESSVFPVLLTNDHPRIRGDFDLRMLLDMVEAEMEVADEQGL